MIGLDTNVLLRYFVKDDAQQSQIVRNLIGSLSGEEPGWLSVVVLVELLWTLKYSYRFTRTGIADVVKHLLSSRDIAVEQEDLAREALLSYGNSSADFADCLIAVSARSAGCSKTVTFDRIAARDAGMELLA
jgi:predicted nucleic-acid-binding protein